MSGRRKKAFPMLLWHRRLGLVALFFIAILAITGIALNHTESLKLDRQMLANDWLLDWYGLNPKNEPFSFAAGEHLVTQWDDQLFFDTQPLLSSQQTLRGAVALDQLIVVALQQQVVLLNKDGEIIERMPISSAMAHIESIGHIDQHLVVSTIDNHLFMADEQIINWHETGARPVQWPAVQDTPQTLQARLKTIYRGEGLSLERVLLDLHSGRLFSAQWGIYIMDASALILLWLGLSGFWVWHSRKRKLKTKKHYQKHHRP